MQDNMETQQFYGFGASDTTDVSEVKPVLSEGDEILDMGDDFDFGDFQVVRREFFAHLREPSISFNENYELIHIAYPSLRLRPYLHSHHQRM